MIPSFLQPSGVVLVDKPQGMTSHDVVARLRKATGIKRIGHAGTLDPMATGLLVILFGSATRLSDRLSAHDKTYEATITFGSKTDTDDAEGAVLSSQSVDSKIFDKDFVHSVIKNLVGEQLQTPPQYSALKVDGKRAYVSARKGSEVELAARPIEIHAAEVIQIDAENRSWTLRIAVSKGTYIRSIARDLGEQVGCGAHLSALRRLSTNDGLFSLGDAHTLDELEEIARVPQGITQAFIPLDLLGFNPDFEVKTLDRDVLNGRYQFFVGPLNSFTSTTSALMLISNDERLLGLGTYEVEDGFTQLNETHALFRIRPRTVFPGGIMGPNLGACVMTMGVFDGVHLGHQVLLQEVASQAIARGVKSVAFTFDPHPQAILSDTFEPHALCTLEQRITLIKSQGIDEVCVIPFNQDMAQLSGEDFLTYYVSQRCQPCAFVVGEGFRFGARGASTIESIASYAQANSLECLSVELKMTGAQKVSSTDIRAALCRGDAREAALLLGHPYQISGHVTTGQKMGATLGAPTANIVPHLEVLLAQGVYSAYVHYDGSRYQAALFIGTPRGDDQAPTVEVSLLDFQGSLYGETLFVEPLAQTDIVERFANYDELQKGVLKKMAGVRAFFDQTEH